MHGFLILLLCTADVAAAQTVVVPVQGILVGADGLGLTPGMAMRLPPGVRLAGVPGAPDAGAVPSSPEEAKLQEILQLQFDRRPSAILQSMAERGAAAAITNDVLRFKKSVDSGDWAEVGRFLAQLPTNQVDRVFLYVVRGLQRIPQGNPGQPEGDPGMVMMMAQGAPRPEPFILPDDVLAVAALKPGPLSDDDVQALGQLLGRAGSRGNSLDPLLRRLKEGTGPFGGDDATQRLRTAKLLFAAGRPVEAGTYLPPVESLTAPGDPAILALHAQSLAAQGSMESRREAIQRAWDLNLTVLRATNATPDQRKAALGLTFQLLPQVRGEAGTNWLRDTFVNRPEEGLTVLSAVADMIAMDAANRDVERRRANFQLQKRLVDDLLAVAGEHPDSWTPALNLLAVAWMQEGEFTRARHRPRRNRSPQFDPFGNQVYFGDDQEQMMMYQDPNQLPPVPVDQLLPTAPGERWTAALDSSLTPRLRTLLAELFFKAEEETKALPLIESLAVDQPKVAQRLANDYLRTWARTHDPNPPQQNNYPRYFYPGMMQPSGIPLTRALQARNLRELAEVLTRLRSLPIPALDDPAVVGAFTGSHSPAEVFRQDDIERVFGPVEQITPATLSALLQTMRERLSSQWRSARVQQDAKTKRTDKEVESEVTRGYELLNTLTEGALLKRPDDWRLNLVQASMLFDWAEFDYGKKVDLKLYVAKRDLAFKTFEAAATQYTAQLPLMEEKDQTPLVFQQWFNATLGASDLAYLTRQQEADTNHLARVRISLHALPSANRERHLSAFGSGITESMNSLKPELKPRYLKAGLAVMGDHPSVAEVRKVVQHYEDLLQEVALDVRLDGPAEVGHTSPFGVFIAIRYTDALGREGGNFTKYLQNQQGQNSYYNPYGTPPVNYRDDFEKQVKEKWSPGFEILAVTFHDEKVESRGYGRDGWRETPYAYALLKAKDASVDRIPPLRLDLDFVDRRGPVILPVQSQVQLIDARSESGPARPLAGVECVQILDDREAALGRIGLEIKATGQGLLPDLGELIDLRLPGFKIGKKPEAPLTLTRLDTAGDSVAAVSERSVLLALVPDDSGPAPSVFRFPAPRRDGMTNLFKRYADADLVEVKPEVALEGLRLRPRPWWPWVSGGVVVVAIIAGVVQLRRRREVVDPQETRRYSMPHQITPFSVLQLLQRLAADRSLVLTDERRSELVAAIRDLEARYFSPAPDRSGYANLEEVAKRWVSVVE